MEWGHKRPPVLLFEHSRSLLHVTTTSGIFTELAFVTSHRLRQVIVFPLAEQLAFTWSFDTNIKHRHCMFTVIYISLMRKNTFFLSSSVVETWMYFYE